MFWLSKLISAVALAGPLVDAAGIVPGLQVDARYYSDWNFLGHRVRGYEANRCLLTPEAAKALKEVQDYVKPFGLSLLAFDCYRPQRAVDDFVAWVKGPSGDGMKPYFFPAEDRARLIERGYIDAHSGHSRGSTIDLTLVSSDVPAGDHREERADCRSQKRVTQTGQLDMGTTFDCFSELAYTAEKTVSAEARRNRLLLKAAMEKAGFVNYPKEWWHFTLKNEPIKDRFLDLPVR